MCLALTSFSLSTAIEKIGYIEPLFTLTFLSPSFINLLLPPPPQDEKA
jgi:hypothetical protein